MTEYISRDTNVMVQRDQLAPGHLAMDINDTVNVLPGERENVPMELIVLMRVVSCIIVVVNQVVLLCLVKGRHTFTSAYWYQIVCITSSDILAGVSSFVMSFVDLPLFGQNIVACSITVGLFFITQCATLYNILAICIGRFVVLKGFRRSAKSWKKMHTIYGTIGAWTVSVLLCSAPFFVWADADSFHERRFCSMRGIFGVHVSSAMKVLLGSFLIPLVLTDALYCLVFVVLRRELRVLLPRANLAPAVSLTTIQMESKEEANGSAWRSSGQKTENDQKTMYRCQGVQTEVCMSSRGSNGSSSAVYLANGRSGERYDRVQTEVCMPPLDTQTSVRKNEAYQEVVCKVTHSFSITSFTHIEHLDQNAVHLTTFANTCDNNIVILDTIDVGNESSEFQLTETSTNEMINTASSRAKTVSVTAPILRIRKAFMLLGLILLALNIFTWPGLIALLFGSMLDSVHFSRSLILPLFATLSLNSIVNPILYTVRVPEFRDAFYAYFMASCKNKCTCSRKDKHVVQV